MKRILIADHSMFSRSILKKLLAKTHYKIIAEAEDGKQAVSKFVRLLPDIVVMEFSLPKLNGFQVLNQMLELDSAANIIMVSSLDEPFLMNESKFLGAKDFLLKPNFPGLITSLNNIEQNQHS